MVETLKPRETVVRRAEKIVFRTAEVLFLVMAVTTAISAGVTLLHESPRDAIKYIDSAIVWAALAGGIYWGEKRLMRDNNPKPPKT